jgi:hypothetical protein
MIDQIRKHQSKNASKKMETKEIKQWLPKKQTTERKNELKIEQ